MASVCGSEANTLVDRQSVWDPEEKSLMDTSSVYSHSKSITLTKEKTYHYYADPQSPPRGGISRVLRSIGGLPSRAMRAVTTLAYSLLAQSNADIQVRGAVLAHAAVIQKRYGGEKRPNQAVNDPLAIVPISRKAVQARASAVKQRLDAQAQSVPTSTYVDLFDLICIVLRVPPGSYSEPLVRRIWNMLIGELQRGRSSDFVAALSQPQCTVEDVGTVLRHVALSHLGGWKPLPPPQLGSHSVQSYVKDVAFSHDTYSNYLALEKAFFEVLCGLLDRRPEAVHATLDGYMHLVWFKFASNTANSASINFAYVLDNLSYVYHPYWKRFDPCPSGEVESLILYLATAPASTNIGESLYMEGKGVSHLAYAIQHICTSLSTIATASLPRTSASSSLSTFSSSNWNIPGIFQLARDHPGLFSGDLAHPALPIILFVAQLVRYSPHVVTLLISGPHDLLGSSYFMESLMTLWRCSFLLPCDSQYTAPAYSGPASVPGPGSGVSREKREYAMRLATCYLLATMSASAHRAEQLGDMAPMDSLVQHFVSSPRLEAWLWDVDSTALALRVTSRKERDRTRTEWRLSQGKGIERNSWGIYEDTLPDILYLVRRIIRVKPPTPFKPTGEPQDVEKLVWMFEEETIDLPLPILTSVLSSTTSSKAWIGALDILDGCHDLNAPHLVSSLRQFAQALLQDAPVQSFTKPTKPSSSPSLSANRATSSSKGEKRTSPGLRTSSSLEPPLFMPHATDRFLMLILSAARRNEALRAGIGRSAETKRVLADLVHAVEGCAFDRGVKLDAQQQEWRARTCRDVSIVFLQGVMSARGIGSE